MRNKRRRKKMCVRKGMHKNRRQQLDKKQAITKEKCKKRPKSTRSDKKK